MDAMDAMDAVSFDAVDKLRRTLQNPRMMSFFLRRRRIPPDGRRLCVRRPVPRRG
jgi:hypothetical protein